MSETAINEAWNAISYYMLDEEQRKAYDGCEKAERDYYSFLAGALEEGEIKGKAEGREEEKRKIVLNLLKNGQSLVFIANVAEMPAAEIRKLAEENGIELVEK